MDTCSSGRKRAIPTKLVESNTTFQNRKRVASVESTWASEPGGAAILPRASVHRSALDKYGCYRKPLITQLPQFSLGGLMLFVLACSVYCSAIVVLCDHRPTEPVAMLTFLATWCFFVAFYRYRRVWIAFFVHFLLPSIFLIGSMADNQPLWILIGCLFGTLASFPIAVAAMFVQACGGDPSTITGRLRSQKDAGFYLTCPCGRKMFVGRSEAGSETKCACGGSMRVPSLDYACPAPVDHSASR